LEGLTISDIQGWLALDPLQELFDQLEQQLTAEQITQLNDILGEIGLPDLETITSSVGYSFICHFCSLTLFECETHRGTKQIICLS